MEWSSVSGSLSSICYRAGGFRRRSHRRHHHSITHYRATFKSGKGTPLFTPLFTHSTTPPLHFTGEPAHFFYPPTRILDWAGTIMMDKVFVLDFITRRVFLVTSERKELITGLLVQSTLTDTSSVQQSKNHETLHTNFLVGVGSLRQICTKGAKLPVFVSDRLSTIVRGELWTLDVWNRIIIFYHVPFCRNESWGYRTGTPFWHTPCLRVAVTWQDDYDYDIMILFLCLSYFFLSFCCYELNYAFFTNIRIRKRKEKMFH